MALVCCLCFVFMDRDMQVRSFECSLVDHDPWTVPGPSIAHDLELQRNG